MDLEAALKEFVTIFNRSEKCLGIVEMRDPAVFESPFPLGGILTEYFARLLLKDDPIVGGAMQLMLFSVDELVTAQGGWRWVRDSDGNQVENEKWKSSWVVIADRDGDAIFVDIDSQNGDTYGSIQQSSVLISTNFSDFLSTFAECMVVEKDQFEYEVLDSEYNTIEPFLVEVRRIAENKLGTDGKDAFMKFFFS